MGTMLMENQHVTFQEEGHGNLGLTFSLSSRQTNNLTESKKC